jgi:uncharacterized membrane protein
VELGGMPSTGISGYTCAFLAGIFWLATYLGIIWSGFKDRSYGMPLVALSMNVSWECIFPFVYPPMPALGKYRVRAWFLLDIPIAMQCLPYSRNEFKQRLANEYAHIVFTVTMGICFALVLGFIREFKDFSGVYSSFSANVFMSICFVFMLINRDDLRAQSIYIAVFKSLGTFFAFLWAYFWFPVDINTPPTSIIPVRTQPMSPFIKMMYVIIFSFDLLYVILVYRKSLGVGFNAQIEEL